MQISDGRENPQDGGPAMAVGPEADVRYLLVATIKNEALNLLEWVAWHRMIGFTDILVYYNNCEDSTARTLRIMQAAGLLRAFPNDFPPDHPAPPFQNRAYRRAGHEPEYAAARWCMALDADEFLLIHAGNGTLADLTAACGSADAMRINWRVFGNSGLTGLDAGLQTERFTLAMPQRTVQRWPVAVKTLFRTASYGRIGIHLPHLPRQEAPKVVTGSGLPLDEVRVRGFNCTDPGRYALAQVNHYMVRDCDSFLIKSDRGSSSHPEREIRADYWRKWNRNDERETAILSRRDRLLAEMQHLDALTGGRLMALRRRALRYWRGKVAQLKTREDMAELYNTIANTGPPVA
ncbi:MAG: glycosyltransferase family 2 protein [Rhodobacteraceae bacterium]|nr:glycosyltransferase family 2 protein [Paracoccaceae bacterium]